jgi:hypothetical protein
LKKEEKRLSTQSSSLEKTINNSSLDVGNKLFEMILQQVEIWKKRYPTTDVLVLQAEFQADSVIAYQTMQQLNDMVFMYDSDLAALCGKECVSIGKYEFIEDNSRNSEIKGMEICFADISTLNEICVHMDLKIENKASRTNFSQYPIYDGISYHYTRAIISVGLGCDVYVGGVPGISLAKLYKQLAYLQGIHGSNE